MNDFLNLILPFFAIIFIGYAFGRLKWIDAAAGGALNAFVFKVALPAFIFKMLWSVDVVELIQPAFMSTHFLTGAALFFSVFAIYRLVGNVPTVTAAYCAQSTMVPNNGYLGVPLITALLGPVGGIAATLCLLVETMLFIPMAVIVAGFGTSGEKRQNLFITLLKVYKTLLTNPFIMAVFVAMAASFFEVKLHTGVVNLIDFLAAATGPTALFAIGLSLSLRKLEDGLGDVVLLSALKILVHPLLVAIAFLIILPQFGASVDPTWIVAAVLVAALPTATHVFLFADQAGADVKYVSGTILLSSLIGVITFPLIKFLIELLV